MVNLTTILGLDMSSSRWRVALKLPDPALYPHAFYVAPAALVYRAAEYGIDPADSVTLMDIILHQGFVSIDRTHPLFVANTDEVTALKYLNAQIAEAKKTNQVVDPDNHLTALHQAYKPDMKLHGDHRLAMANLRKTRVPSSVGPLDPKNKK